MICLSGRPLAVIRIKNYDCTWIANARGLAGDEGGRYAVR
jgi:hypothetical protein